MKRKWHMRATTATFERDIRWQGKRVIFRETGLLDRCHEMSRTGPSDRLNETSLDGGMIVWEMLRPRGSLAWLGKKQLRRIGDDLATKILCGSHIDYASAGAGVVDWLGLCTSMACILERKN
ncbi:hypothetical protein CB0940_11431 [Cercospora beticola]|uniref:Uncharacterized protein n=1 Tax=Cercospora beticola TaxID=122368 RepID=A0A2G5HEB8_CERBT|nr:hypothetical protein CB0940_11431 [Cercospora beticola]PIA90901.1 hypothetical protein CB0940_11431 [Cercospora beticola]